MQATTTTSKKLTKTLIDANENSDLNGISIMDCIVSGSSGERTIPKELVKVKGVQIKSKALSGTKISWFPKDKLSFVNTISRGTKQVFNKYGVRYGSYTLIPTSLEDKVEKELKELEAQYEAEVKYVVNNFDNLIAEHIAENDDIADLINDFKLSVDDFEARFKFKSFAPMAFQPRDSEDVDQVVTDVSQSLYEEIAKQADKIFQKSIVGRDKLSIRIVSSLSNIYNKMASLAWLDEGIVKILSEFRDLILKLPSNGGIDGQLKAEVSYMVVLMSDANKLKALGEGTLPSYEPIDDAEDEDDEDIVSPLMIQRANVDVQIPTEVITEDISSDLADAW